ncbi:TrkH family potassium uptake protein [Candidatus Peregrinibacteria bacterium]|nr:TrkH family potassium uptake protein [Candidatus Peregrinibacteria bacterium]
MRILLRNLGYLLIISSFFRLVPIITGLYYGEDIQNFLFTFGFSLVLGVVLVLFNRLKEDNRVLTLTQGLILGALAFILLPAISMITYLPSMNYDYLNAYFEAISGFTTTGITVYNSLEELPKSLLLWRAETQWMGGIGIIIIFLFLFSRRRKGQQKVADLEEASEASMALYQAQGFGQKLEGGLRRTLAVVMAIYVGYTLLGILLLRLTGMPLYDSVAMSFTALSTGGFSVHNEFYTNGWQLTVLSIIMILGSISFIVHFKMIEGKWKDFLFSFEKNVFLVLIVVAGLLTISVTTNWTISLFELVSAFTATGYNISNFALLPPLLIFVMMLGMIIGGSSSSTSGGIKVFRIYYLIRGIGWQLKKLSSPPNAVIPLSIHGQETDEKNISNIAIFVIAYMFTLVLGIIVFLIFDFSFFDASFQMISALGTVGLQSIDVAVIHPLLKIILIISMLFGRLEIFPILILIRRIFK